MHIRHKRRLSANLDDALSPHSREPRPSRRLSTNLDDALSPHGREQRPSRRLSTNLDDALVSPHGREQRASRRLSTNLDDALVSPHGREQRPSRRLSTNLDDALVSPHGREQRPSRRLSTNLDDVLTPHNREQRHSRRPSANLDDALSTHSREQRPHTPRLCGSRQFSHELTGTPIVWADVFSDVHTPGPCSQPCLLGLCLPHRALHAASLLTSGLVDTDHFSCTPSLQCIAVAPSRLSRVMARQVTLPHHGGAFSLTKLVLCRL